MISETVGTRSTMKPCYLAPLSRQTHLLPLCQWHLATATASITCALYDNKTVIKSINKMDHYNSSNPINPILYRNAVRLSIFLPFSINIASRHKIPQYRQSQDNKVSLYKESDFLLQILHYLSKTQHKFTFNTQKIYIEQQCDTQISGTFKRKYRINPNS